MRFFRTHRMANRLGFTLVELLVVMAFIAILAAIAVPHFASVTDRAHDAEVKSDIRNAMAAEEKNYIHGGGYVAFVSIDGDRAVPPGFTSSPGVTVQATLLGKRVRVVGIHPNASTIWCMNSDGGDIVPGDDC